MDFEYQVALSFAGEQRDYVEDVAKELKRNRITVFYDGFEEASLWGKNLYTHLREVYRDKANYTIIFSSKEYAEKVWCNLELIAAQERALKENREYVLPARFDDTVIPGLPTTVAYIDLRNKSPQELSDLLQVKLNLSSDVGDDGTLVVPITDVESALVVIQQKTKFLWLELMETDLNKLECSSEIKESTIKSIHPAIECLEKLESLKWRLKSVYVTESNEKVMIMTLFNFDKSLVDRAKAIEQQSPRNQIS